MNEIQLFQNPEFGNVRTITENETILFCGSDVAKALGYVRPNEAISQHCKEDGTVFHRITDSLGRPQSAKFISEGNLYRLIVNSKLPSAEKFERWIFDEVLPSIRKHGGYLTKDKLEEALLNPDTLIQLAQSLKAERERSNALQSKIELDKPKVLFADSVETAKNSILIGDLAKLISQNGYDIGQKRLFEWLRENGYLLKHGESYNSPSQYSMELGLMEVKVTTINNSDGSIRTTRTTKVTGKGQIYFVNKFLGR